MRSEYRGTHPTRNLPSSILAIQFKRTVTLASSLRPRQILPLVCEKATTGLTYVRVISVRTLALQNEMKCHYGASTNRILKIFWRDCRSTQFGL